MLTAVTGVRGGIGTTTLAVALARRVGAVLVDADGLAGGVDVWLGAEERPGLRWSGLGLAGGALDPSALSAALPRVDGVGVLAADRPDLPTAEGLAQVLDVLGDGQVVVDLPRRVDAVTAVVCARCAPLLLVVPADVGGAVAVHAWAEALEARVALPATTGLVVVGDALSTAALEAAVGLPVLAAVASAAELGRVADGLAEAMGSLPAEAPA